MLASYTTWALSLYLLSCHIGNAQAQVATVTLPYADGDTLVVSTGTNALGLPTTFATLSTVTRPVAGGAGAVPPAVNTLTNTLINTATRTTATRAPGAGAGGAGAGAAAEQETAPAAGAGDGAGQIVQGDTLPPPQKTFSYNLDGVDHTWTAVTTRLATIATALVPQGTLQNFEAYQSAVNGRVFEDAKDKEEEKLAAQGGGRATGGAGASFRIGEETGGMWWAVVWIGGVGILGMAWF